jgi:hypothetical protein
MLPNPMIKTKGPVSAKFIDLSIQFFWDACQYVQSIPYGYNSSRDDIFIIFKEGIGSCTTKHAVIATLAEELDITVYKTIGIYEMNEDLVTGTQIILEKYQLPYIPMIHCFLEYNSYNVDLTEPNNNGKNHAIDEFLFVERVTPNISEKNEYRLYRKILNDHVLLRKEMRKISLLDVLHARIEGIRLLRSKVAS